jgi:hypothetical protein
MAQTWNDAKQQKVFYKVGTFNGDQSAIKLIEAPFDVVKIGGKIYCQPKSIGITSESFGQGVNADAEQARFKRQMFYTEAEMLILEEHQIGASDNANWLGMHSFGWT